MKSLLSVAQASSVVWRWSRSLWALCRMLLTALKAGVAVYSSSAREKKGHTLGGWARERPLDSETVAIRAPRDLAANGRAATAAGAATRRPSTLTASAKSTRCGRRLTASANASPARPASSCGPPCLVRRNGRKCRRSSTYGVCPDRDVPAQARRVCTRLAGGLHLRAVVADGGGIGPGRGARQGAGRMLLTALEAGVAVYSGNAREEKGHAVRSGRARERPVTMDSATVAIRAPRGRAANGRAATVAGATTRRPSTLSASVRSTRWPGARRPTASANASPASSWNDRQRSPKVSQVLPIVYLRGLSTAREALAVLLDERPQAAARGRAGASRLARREAPPTLRVP